MGKLKDEVVELITESRSLKRASDNSKRWLKSAVSSNGIRTAKKTNEKFKPGKIYIFKYMEPVTVKPGDIWDHRPMVLSLGQYEGTDIGINLNFLPYSIKLQVLDKVYEQFYNKIQKSTKNGNSVDNEREISEMTYENIKRFLGQFGYLKAVRRYKTSNRSNSIVISYSEWKQMAVLNVSNISK